MLKKTIKYTDFNDEEVEEDHFFHLSQAELVELELSHEGGFTDSLKKIVEAQDGKAIMVEFKNIILSAYGKKSPDGKRFIKNATVREEFESSEAYSTLFMELVTDADAAAEFVNGVIPKGLADDAAKVVAADLTVVPDPKEEPEPKEIELITVGEPEVISRQSIQAMGADELTELGRKLASGAAVLGDSV